MKKINVMEKDHGRSYNRPFRESDDLTLVDIDRPNMCPMLYRTTALEILSGMISKV